MPVKINGTTSGSVTLAAPATGSDVTLTLPGSAGTAALTTDTGLAFITSSTFSAVSSVSVNNCFTSTYDSYRLIIDLTAASASNQLSMRMRVSGADNTGASSYVRQSLIGSSTTASASTASISEWQWGDTGATNAPGVKTVMDIHAPALSRLTVCNVHQGQINNAGALAAAVALYYFNATTVFDGFSVYTNTGTISGTVRVYGYRNS